MNFPLTDKLRFKLLCLSLGMTTGVGLATLGQTLTTGCAGVSCTMCGACLSRLPILVLPVFADGVVVLGRKIIPLWKKRGVSP